MERVRRAHLNDMENILPYLMVSFLYVLTRPDFYTASILFGLAAIARFIHTYVYAIHVIRQPARALMFHVHFWIMLYMIVVSILHFFKLWFLLKIKDFCIMFQSIFVSIDRCSFICNQTIFRQFAAKRIVDFSQFSCRLLKIIYLS